VKSLVLVLVVAPLFAQVEDRSTETRTFAGVRELVLDNVNGTVEITGDGGREVVMEVAKFIRAESNERLEAARREVKLEASESNGRLKLLVDEPFRCNCDSWDRRRNGYHVNYDFKLRIPADAVFDVRTVNGELTMERIAGAGKAATVNGEVLVVYAKNPPGPAEFETINGNVDVSFPPGLSADLRMKTMNGGMYTDFDVSPLPVQAAAAERRNGKFVYRTEGAARVRVAGGGPEINFKTLNGNIYVRSRN
jgi:DUF4097 and DUF4098 domain-containing protein YvlB